MSESAYDAQASSRERTREELDCDFILIPLSKGRSAIVDARHAEHLLSHKWSLATSRDGRQWVRTGKGGKLLHAEVLRLEGVEVAAGQEIDHRNGDGLDNRANNLRPCTHQQNTFNRKKRSDGQTSRFKGVYWSKRYRRFEANIRVSGRKRYLGRFVVEEDAAAAYRKAAEQAFGQFACTRGEP